MKRPEQHITDTAAKKIFESTIPNKWVHRSQESDYGIDYEIEMFENNLSTGIIFKIQLKGTKTIDFIDHENKISFSFNIDNIHYYLNEINIPMFIVIVDIENKNVYWHNPLLDETLKTNFNNAKIKSHEHLTVHINPKHKLPDDINKLQYEYMSPVQKVFFIQC